MKNKIIIILFLCMVFFARAEGKDLNIKENFKNTYEKIKAKSPFKKKEVQPKPKMVETYEEWENEAQNIPLEDREIKEEKQEIDTKKYHVPPLKYTFQAYNYPQGKREYNLENIKKDLFYMPYLTVDKECKYAAYPNYYYSPDTNQISSSFFVEELDTSKSKIKRILEYKHQQKERIPVLESGTKETYPNSFHGLVLVDWSSDSKKLLIKEKIGSTLNGIYKTNLYIHFVEEDIENSYSIKLGDFDLAIKHYFLDWKNKQISKYRYDIEPLGFSADNDNMIIAICYVYDNNNKKIYLGTWGYDFSKRETSLISKTGYVPNLSVNGLFLKHSYN